MVCFADGLAAASLAALWPCGRCPQILPSLQWCSPFLETLPACVSQMGSHTHTHTQGEHPWSTLFLPACMSGNGWGNPCRLSANPAESGQVHVSSSDRTADTLSRSILFTARYVNKNSQERVIYASRHPRSATQRIAEHPSLVMFDYFSDSYSFLWCTVIVLFILRTIF